MREDQKVIWRRAGRKYREKHHETELVRYRKVAKERYRLGLVAPQDTVKSKCRYTLRNAVICGKVNKPDACSVCGKGGRIEAHHKDYSKPFEVLWLCTSCHGKEHRKYA